MRAGHEFENRNAGERSQSVENTAHAKDDTESHKEETKAYLCGVFSSEYTCLAGFMEISL